MVFPYLETLDGYAKLAESAGLGWSSDGGPERRTLPGTCSRISTPGGHSRAAVVAAYGQAMYDEVERGIALWRDASAAGQVGRGRVIARKPAA